MATTNWLIVVGDQLHPTSCTALQYNLICKLDLPAKQGLPGDDSASNAISRPLIFVCFVFGDDFHQYAPDNLKRIL